MTAVLAALIAVFGTLAGAVVSGMVQRRAARAERADRLIETRRQARVEVVTDLARAVTDHRRAMWDLRNTQLTDPTAAERITVLRDESRRTRSAIAGPAVRLRLEFRDGRVRGAADDAIRSTYVMREAGSLEELQAQRRTAIAAHDALVDVAAHLIGVMPDPGGAR